MCVVCGGTGAVLQSSASPQPARHRHPNASVGTSDVAREFAFRVQDFVRHPAHDEIWACWQHNPGNCLDIGLSVNSNIRIELANYALDTWLQVRDDSGHPVPLAIRMDPDGQLLGRWL
jgi:hypothetical protein